MLLSSCGGGTGNTSAPAASARPATVPVGAAGTAAKEEEEEDKTVGEVCDMAARQRKLEVRCPSTRLGYLPGIWILSEPRGL